MDIADLLDIDLTRTAITLDSGFDSDYNRAMIGRYGLRAVIKPNRRKNSNPLKLAAIADMIEADREIYKERYKIERCFAWEDIYRKLVIRYERLQCTHLGFKYLAYSMINLRWFIKNK